MATSKIKNQLSVQTSEATGNAIDITYVKSGNVVQVCSKASANMDMTAGESYTLNATMPYPPATAFSTEIFCRNGVEAYINIDPTVNPMFTIVPRANISRNQSIAFSFTYIAAK